MDWLPLLSVRLMPVLLAAMPFVFSEDPFFLPFLPLLPGVVATSLPLPRRAGGFDRSVSSTSPSSDSCLRFVEPEFARERVLRRVSVLSVVVCLPLLKGSPREEEARGEGRGEVCPLDSFLWFST